MRNTDNQLHRVTQKIPPIGSMIAALWSFIALMILVLVVFFQQSTDYNRKVSLLLGNATLLILGLSILSAVTYFNHSHKIAHKIWNTSLFASNGTIVIASVFLFTVQAYVFWNIYFQTGWDVNWVWSTSMSLVHGGDYWKEYYSYYPNNLGIVWIITNLLRINDHIGNQIDPYFFVILVQCALSCIAGCILFALIKKLLGLTYGYFAWVIYVFHIAFSPWLSITYTDGMALIIPISVLWLYQKNLDDRHWWKWVLIGAVGCFGYRIKPQCIIVLIAIFIVELFRSICCNKKQRLEIAKNLSIALFTGCLMMLLCNHVLFSSLGITVDPEKEIGSTHFAMMGLNTETDGAYAADDVSFSQSFSTKQERVQGNLSVIKQRLQKMGFTGFVKHIAKKTLVNFGDGTYAWAREGNFYATVYEPRNSSISPLLRSFYYSTGSNYQWFALMEQCIWVTMIFCTLGCIFYFRNRRNKPLCVESVALLTLIGATLFQTIFESRNRYFFVNSPIFIVAAGIGWIGLREELASLVAHVLKKNHPI